MTTPERSIDEIVKEVLALEHEIDEDDNWISTDEDIANIVRFVVKAERQKRDEVVRAERERICKDLDEMWSALYGAYLNNQDLRELIKNLVTQPNNPDCPNCDVHDYCSVHLPDNDK